MKILAITDGGSWCLDKLTQAVIRDNPHHSWKVLKVHPKAVGNQLPEIMESMKWADLVWHQYFRTAAQLCELIPDLFSQCPQILTHHNQRDKVFEYDYKWASMIVCHTEKMKKKLEDYGYKNVKIIRHGIDLSFFDYDQNPYDSLSQYIVGYVGRTKPWKRLKDIKDVCDELQVPMVGMGRKDDGYANTVNWEGFDWSENIPDEDRFDVYKKMSVFVNFSQDDYEEGPMPVLEAMASGVPVITTRSGVCADIIQHGRNGYIVNNKEDLKRAIMELRDRDLRNRIRENAWGTIKAFSEQKMALCYDRLFSKTLFKSASVSVVIPTYKRPDLLGQILDSLACQSYKALEVVVADDDPEMSARSLVENKREQYPSLPIRYIATLNSGYGLAQARNMGAIEAQGDYLIFLDDRYAPDPNAIYEMVKAIATKKKKIWVFGDKGAQKKEFVENFSGIRRIEFFELGMFNERITAYGAMSQEVRTRANMQGFEMRYVPEAKATTLHATRRMSGRRQEIWRMKHLLFKMGLTK